MVVRNRTDLRRVERIFFDWFDIQAELRKTNFLTQKAAQNRKNILY